MEERILAIKQGLISGGIYPTKVKMRTDIYTKIAEGNRLTYSPRGIYIFGLKIEIDDDVEYEFEIY